MHPTNYKSSERSSLLQVYFQILWVAKQFSDIDVFHEMPIESLKLRLDYENHSIRKGNDDPLNNYF